MKKLFESRAVVLECQAKQRLVEKEIELEHLRQKCKREWQGLTDEEQQELYDAWIKIGDGWGSFYALIEAKLKERNT